MGTVHASVPPIFWRSTNVLLYVRETTNRVKKGVIKELYSETGGFLVKKGSYMTFVRAKIGKIWKTWASKWNFFPNKTSFKNLGLRKKFPSPKLGATSPPMGVTRWS